MPWHLRLVGICLTVGLLMAALSLSPQAFGAGRDVVLPAFDLVDEDGRRMDRNSLLGAPSLLVFGFTHCPDVCPTTLMELTQDLASIGPDAQRLRVLFVTVDPERDRPEALKAYLSAFDPRIRGVTGRSEDISALAEQIGAYFRKAGSGPEYSVDHTGSAFLFSSDGSLFKRIDGRNGPLVTRDLVRRVP